MRVRMCSLIHNAAMGAATVSSTMSSCARQGTGSRGHGSPRTVCGIERSTSPCAAVVLAPSSLAGECCRVESIICGGTGSVDEWSVAEERDMVDCMDELDHCMVVMGAIGLGVYFAKPAPSRSFPSKSTF